MSVEQMSLVWKLDLAPNQKIVLLAYADHAHDDGSHVFPSLKRIAYKTGYSRDQVRRISRELKENGLMEQVADPTHNRPAEYKLTLERGSKLPPLEKRGVANDPPQVGAPMPPEPSIEPSVIPTGGKEHNSLEEPNRTDSQHLTDDFYNRIKGRYGITLEKEQYEFHLGSFRNMLKKYQPDEQETLKVIAYMVDRYPSSPKIRATTAIQDVRLGRDTGEAWEGPPPWEKNREKSYYEKRYPDESKEIDPEQKAIIEENKRMLAELLEGAI